MTTLVSGIKRFGLNYYEFLRSISLPQATHSEFQKYRDTVDRDIKLLFTRTIFTMDHVISTYSKVITHLTRKDTKKRNVYELHDRAVILTERLLQIDEKRYVSGF